MRRLLIGCSLVSWAASALAAGGTTTAEFLKFGVGARYLAMGGAAVATARDATAVYWNPANLGYLQQGHLTMMRADVLETGQYSFIALAGPVRSWGGLGASLQSASAGKILMTDETGFSLGQVQPRDTAASLGWGRRFSPALAAGLGGEWVHSRIIHSANAFSLDAGMAGDWRELSYGMSVRHLISSQLEYDREKGPLPRALQAGVAYRLKTKWTFALDLNDTRGSDLTAGAGVEFAQPLALRQTVFLRTGYQTRPGDLPGSQGLTMGLGWRWNSVDVDYAFLPMGNVDGPQTHRFSIGARFGTPSPDLPRPKSRAEMLAPAAYTMDEDGDGVVDAFDQCPQTPPNSKVDAKGCPLTHRAPIAMPGTPAVTQAPPVTLTSPHPPELCPAAFLGHADHKNGCTIHVKPEIHFHTDSANLRGTFLKEVGVLAGFLEKNPEYDIIIEGHADARGTDEYNDKLSVKRASQVKRMLSKKYKVAESRIGITGLGESSPVASNATAEGRRLNRRAAVKLFLPRKPVPRSRPASRGNPK